MNPKSMTDIRAAVDTLSGEPLREFVADMMGQSIAVGAVPRDVIMRELRARTDEHLRDLLRQAIAYSDEMMADALANGTELAIGYDVAELERVREIQRKMK